MTTLKEFRAQHPQYDDMPDNALADALHKKFYSDIPRTDFDKRLGLASAPATAPAKEPGNEGLNTAAVMAGGFTEGARQGGNIIGLLSGMADLTKGSLSQMPVQSAAMKALGTSPEGVASFLKRNAPLTDPIRAWQGPGLSGARAAFQGVTGLDPATDLASKAAAYKATGAEKTPLREALAGGVEIAGSMLPTAGLGPVGQGLKLTAASAALGGVGSALAGDTGKTIGALLPALAAFRSGKAPKPPTAEALKDQAQAAYKTAEAAGVVISENSFGNAVLTMARDAAKQGMHPKLHPRAVAVLESAASEIGQPMTLERAETLRRVFKSAASSADPSERRLVMRMVDKFDDYISGLKPGDILAGDAKKATEALTEARGLWSKARKSEVVEELVDRAKTRASQFSGSGYENALRTEFRNLSLSPRRMRTFSAEEQAAIKKVAKGGPLENILRLAGKFAPTGVVSSALSGGVGFATAGPAGAVALPAIGFAARKGATALTQRNAQNAAELMRRGGPAQKPVNPYLPVLPRYLAVE